MKNYIYAMLLIFGICTTANGAEICIRQASSAYNNTLSPDEDNNRGSWDNLGSMAGESHCSEVGILTHENRINFEKNGKFCWCRVTQVIAQNGEWLPRNGAWVFRNIYNQNNTSAGCAKTCAYYCSRNVNTWPDMRRVALISEYLEL